MGSLQDEIKRFQREPSEKLSDDMNEVKKEIYGKINRDSGSMIKQDVNNQCDIKVQSPELKKAKDPAHRRKL